MTRPGARFDDLNLRARVYPGLLMCSPIQVAILMVAPASLSARVIVAIVSAGAVFALADWVRGRGQTLERALVRDWGGMPTAKLLALAGAPNIELTKRRRANLKAKTGISIPSRRDEKDDPAGSALKYDAAVRAAIPHLRGKKNDYLLHEENVRYGFRRNTLAVRPFTLTSAAIGVLMGVAALALGRDAASALVCVAYSLLVGLLNFSWVTSEWVYQAAQTYAERFFDALEQRDGR